MNEEILNEIKDNFQQLIKIQSLLLDCFNSNINDVTSFQKLMKLIVESKVTKNPHKLREFMHLLSYLVSLQHLNPTSMDKIEKILKAFQDDIKQLCSPETIYSIFKNSNLILFFIVEKNIFEITPPILDILFGTNNHLPISQNFSLDQDTMQIKPKTSMLISKEKFKKSNYNTALNSIIQKDFADDFVRMRFCMISDMKIKINSEVPLSIFETHAFLKGKSPKMVEYAAFCGSFKIFSFLINQKCELTPNLWLYAIYGKNKQIINKLKEKKLDPPGGSFVNCVIEAIRAHDNQLAKYFITTFLSDQKEQFEFEYLLASIDSYNYEMAAEQLSLCNDLNLNKLVWQLSKSDLFVVLSNIIALESIDLNEIIILFIAFS